MMTPEKLLVPFTDKEKEVSLEFLEVKPLKTETARRTWDQWGLGLRLVPMACAVLYVAS